jgi:hypothetical protein
MPYTVPPGISALVGQKSARAPIFLVEIQWPAPAGTKYYSSGEQVTWNGHTWEKNRAMSIPTFEAGMIDRKGQNTSDLEIRFDNLADDGSASFPFTALEAGQNLEDGKIFIHVYSPDAGTALANRWWGFIAGRETDPDEKSMTFKASFFWGALQAPLPSKLIHQAGFAPSDSSSQNSEENQDELAVPIVYGAGALKVRPAIYRKVPDGGLLHVNFILSGCNGLPFSAGDISAADTKLFATQSAVAVEFLTGTSGQAAPVNLSRFPDGAAHPNVAYAYAAFLIPNENKGKYDNIASDEIKMIIQNGRPLNRTTLPSENPALILEDILRDPNFGFGLPSSIFDSTALTSTVNYVATRYAIRYELHERKPAADIVQYLLANFHGYVTFENGLVQIKCKRNDETASVTFATSDSGQSGRKIHNEAVGPVIKAAADLINQVTVKYRLKKRNNRVVTVYDPNAQTRAGGTYKKPVEDTFDFESEGGVYDETQASILAAIAVREDQNGDLFISWATPFWDGIEVAVGDIGNVYSPDIFNNGSNHTFRITKVTPDTDGDYLIRFEAQVYKQAIYNDDAVALGVDLLRGGTATDAQGRPPDVTPISLTIVPPTTNDTEGNLLTLRAACTVPAHNATTEQSEGLFREPPISEVEIWWLYTDEAITQARRAGSMVVKQTSVAFDTSLDFQVDNFKSRTVQAFYVSIGPNRSRSPLGYIADPTKFTVLSAPGLTSTAFTANVAATTAFNVNDFVQIEREFLKVASKTSSTLTFVNDGSKRLAQFNSASIAHPAGTEIAVAKLSYPFLQRSLLQPQFGYSLVTLLNLLQRASDGVRAVFTDVSPDNLEEHLIYWSTDADAGTNAAKLGVASPAWYLSDPFTPPTGVTLSRTNRQQHYLIPQEQIGPVGTAVFVRVAARNRKRNFSSALSNILNSSVPPPVGVPPPTDAPGTPIAADVVVNQPNPGTGGGAKLVLRVFADVTRLKTFTAVGTTEVVLLLDTGGNKLWKPSYKIEDGSVNFVDIALSYPLAGVLTWVGVRSWSSGGHKDSAASSILIAAGGFQTSASAIINPTIAAMQGIDDKHSYLTYSYGQPVPPASPVLLATIAVLRQLPGEPGFLRENEFETQNAGAFMVPGTIQVTTTVKHPKKALCNWKMRFISIDGSFVDTPVFAQTTPDVDTAAPNNGTAIAITHAAVKNGRTLIVRFSLPIAQMVSHVRNTLIIHDNNATGAGRRFFDPVTQTWVATYSDGSTEIDLAKGGVPSYNTPVSALAIGGRTAIHIRIGVWNNFNGGSPTYSPDVGQAGYVGQILLNTAGNEPADADTAAPILASPSAPLVQEKDGALYCSAPPPVGNVKTLDQIRFIMSTQATPPTSAQPTIGSEGVVAIKHGDTVTFRPQRPQTVILYIYYEARNQFNNGTYSLWSTGTSVDPSGITRPLKDFIGSGVPPLPMALERSATSGSGHTSTTFTLDAGASGVANFYVTTPPMVLYVPSLNAGDAVRNIIAYNSATKVVTVDTPFSATPPNSIPFEIHRGLERGGKSGSGHTTTAFILDSGASAVDDFYAGMMLYIPSTPTGQKLQRIKIYTGSTRNCTLEAVESALASAPANNCGYMISRGSFGYSNSDGSGTIAPVCYRVWRDNDSNQNVVEPILPTGENAYSMDLYRIQVNKKGDGSIRFDEDVRIGSTPVYRFAAPGGYTPMIRILFFLNAYRESGSNGKSLPTNYVIGFGASTGVGAFNPGTFVPPFTDYRAQSNYPVRYPTY